MSCSSELSPPPMLSLLEPNCSRYRGQRPDPHSHCHWTHMRNIDSSSLGGAPHHRDLVVGRGLLGSFGVLAQAEAGPAVACSRVNVGYNKGI